jgi:SAM-dependent methyltransferase
MAANVLFVRAHANDRAQRIARVDFDPAKRRREHLGDCNLCGSFRFVEVSRRDRYGYDQRAVICARCGLGFLSPRLTADEYAAFYRAVYRPLVSAYHGRRIDAETVQADQARYGDELVDFLRRALPGPPSTVLDVGGSTGVVAGAVRAAFGARATVLDPAPEELAVAGEQGMETIAGFAEDMQPDARSWELVLLCQTVDHLLDVRLTVSRLREVTAPGGYLFVDVLDLPFALRATGTIEGAIKVDHPFYLSRTTARSYLRATGFNIVAERLSDDGHWGFLARTGDPAEPDWPALAEGADALLDEISARRAAT